jgi:hypothetical protein
MLCHCKGQSPIFSGGFAPSGRGEVCHLPLAAGTARSGGFVAGSRQAYLRGFLKAMSCDPNFEYALIDGIIVQVHQKATGAKGGTQSQATGRSRGGLTTKVVALVDALGNLMRLLLLPGQAHDMKGVALLIRGVPVAALLADQPENSARL